MGLTKDGLPQRWMLIVIAALALTWPALVNGGAFYSTDSIAYIREPDQAIGKILGPGHATVWSAKPLGLGFRNGAVDPAASDGKAPPMAGRSIYYGLLANLGARAGGFWLTIAVQALAAAIGLDLLCRAVGWERRRSYLIVAALAAFVTPLGFFVSCVMPDVWAAIAVLALAAMVAGGERLSRPQWVIGAGLVTFAAMAHTSHLLLLASAIGVCGLLAGARRLGWMRVGAPGLTAAVALVALLIGAVSGATFNMAVKKAYGAPPVQPPFLTARLVGDGRPGEAWLRQHCPAAGFKVCAFVQRLPMATDSFLWSADANRSVFWTATPADRTALGVEQFKFAAAVARDEPVAVARQFVIDGATQFADMRMDEFNHKDSVRTSIEGWIVGPDAKVWRASLAYRKGWPVVLMDAVELGAVVLALLSLTVLAVRSARAAPDDSRLRVLSAGMMTAVLVLANAVVCGGLSDIFGRYQARITAPLIVIGAMALAELVRRGATSARRDEAATAEPLPAE
jgi:hypothetical protein